MPEHTCSAKQMLNSNYGHICLFVEVDVRCADGKSVKLKKYQTMSGMR